MKVVFFVQGEGRGHLTQALSLNSYLRTAGHELVGVFIGVNPQRQIPNFFTTKIQAPLIPLASPNFIKDRAETGVDYFKTFFYNSKNLNNYRRQLKVIKAQLANWQPDLIVNFYEPLCGLYNLFYENPSPCVSIAHQYLNLTPHYVFPKNKKLAIKTYKFYTQLTAYGSRVMLALSFKNYPPQKQIFVVPPLLRPEIINQKPESQDFLLTYILNAGWAKEIKAWGLKNPDQEIHCFWDKKDAPEELVENNINFKKISDIKFIEDLKNCAGYLTSAGFESICEALYFNKPFLAVPMRNHLEQSCNALEIEKLNLGITSNHFDTDELRDYAKTFKVDNHEFKTWVESGPNRIIKILEANSRK